MDIPDYEGILRTHLIDSYLDRLAQEGLGSREEVRNDPAFRRSVEQLVDSTVKETFRQIHSNEKHPQFQYTSTPTTTPPKGEGWVVNPHAPDNRNVYWYRHISYAKNEPIALADLPTIVIPRMTLAQIVDALRDRLDDQRIDRGRNPNRSGSKYEYVHRYGELFEADRTDFYDYTWSYDYGPQKAAGWPFELRDRNEVRESLTSSDELVRARMPYLIIALEGHPFRLLIDGAEPETNSWVRLQNTQGFWTAWQRLALTDAVPIHPVTWNEMLDAL